MDKPLHIQGALAASILLLLVGSVHSQGLFEGKVIYDVSYRTEDSSMAQYVALFPSVSELYVSGNKTRYEQAVQGGAQQVFINGGTTQNSILIMSFMGETFKVEISPEEISSLKSNEAFKIVETEEKKEIQGISCKAALALHEGDTMKVYYSPELYEGSMLPQFRELNGLLLEYETVQNGIFMHFKARQVDHKSLSEDQFHASEGMKQVSFEDFAKSFAYKKES